LPEVTRSIGWYILDALLNTGQQVLLFLGPLILLGAIMNVISGLNRSFIIRLFGTRGYLALFGWIGTPIHELAHAIFALLFLHRIHSISLFSPDLESGRLGSVQHGYNPANPYQLIGCFFIGIAPILICPLFLLLLLWLFFGIGVDSFSNDIRIGFLMHSPFIEFDWVVIKNTISTHLETIWTSTASNWILGLFIYLFLAVGSSVALSGADLAGAKVGLLSFLVFLFSINLLTQWSGDWLTATSQSLGNYLSQFNVVMILALAFNLLLSGLLAVLSVFKR
jgi:hypothetical protein